MNIQIKMFVYYIECVVGKDLIYRQINSVNISDLISNIINGYIKENIGDKYLKLSPTDENKDALRKFNYGLRVTMVQNKRYY